MPETQGYPVLGDPIWTPLWDVCAAYDLPVNFHIGGGMENTDWYGSGGWPTDDPRLKMAFGSSQMPLTNFRILSNILLSRFLEKFPKLKIVSVESGVTWIPFMLESLEYQMQDQGIKYEVPLFEIFKRQIYACAFFDRRLVPETARYVGIDNILFETDFPHPTCVYPDPLTTATGAASDLTLEERKKIFGLNSARLYKIPLDGIAA
jgi:predicted TIM-barrel fold metal-dependent hydrolase